MHVCIKTLNIEHFSTSWKSFTCNYITDLSKCILRQFACLLAAKSKASNNVMGDCSSRMIKCKRRHDGQAHVRQHGNCISPCAEGHGHWLSWPIYLMHAGAVLTVGELVSFMILNATHSVTGSQCSISHIYIVTCTYLSFLAISWAAHWKADWIWCKWNFATPARLRLQ